MSINHTNNSFNNSLTGKIIISTPSSDPNSYFSKTVIYIVNHTIDGAIGLVINHPVSTEPSNFNIQNFLDAEVGDIKLNKIKPYAGGPIGVDKGFVLHSKDYQKNVIANNQSVCLSSNLEVLRDISANRGPQNSLFLFGYCGWDAGQLEEEIKNNMWLIAEQNAHLIFETPDRDKWYYALDSLKINPIYYSYSAGNC